MRISKNLEWIEPYIESVKHLIPQHRKLKRVTSRKISLNEGKQRMQRSFGMITKYSTGEYKITLYTNYITTESYEPLVLKVKRLTKMDILKYLAHELAHLQHWDHTPDHTFLWATMWAVFMMELKKEGYTSEEDEIKLLSRCID